MENVLDVYARPYDPRRPLVGMDETSKQLVKETRPAQPLQVGQPARYDAEYERAGVRNLFVAVEPLRGWRQVRVTERRTTQDWAHAIQDLVDVHSPRPNGSCWCWTPSPPTSAPPSTRRSRRPRPGGG